MSPASLGTARGPAGPVLRGRHIHRGLPASRGCLVSRGCPACPDWPVAGSTCSHCLRTARSRGGVRAKQEAGQRSPLVWDIHTHEAAPPTQAIDPAGSLAR